MKKFLTIGSISLCLLSLVFTTCLSLISSPVGTIFYFAGITAGVCGVGFGALAANIERKEFNNKIQINFETADYKENKKDIKTNRDFEKLVKQASEVNTQKINEYNDLIK